MANKTKKILTLVTIILLVGVFGYVTKYVYDSIVKSQVESEIREAGLNPNDYDLTGVAPWNVREFVTNKEIENAGLNPENYKIEGKLTTQEARMEVIRQEIARQLAEYDLSIEDIDLSGVDLLSLSPQEIQDLIYQKVVEKIKR